MSTTSTRWPQAALDARAQVLASIPRSLIIGSQLLEKYGTGADTTALAEESGLLTAEELDITGSHDASSLLLGIKQKRWTSLAVTKAFAKRACIAHQVLTCLCEIFLEEAYARAEYLDDYYERTGQLIGPLHGLPVSLKESYLVKGHVITAAALGRIHDTPVETDGHTVKILRDAGAVFYVRTNLPQTIMHLEAESFWGECKNPYNTRLTPGGSSGGCSALVAFRGSPMSLGGDIGGSLRAPAANCGLWTLKATCLRVPREGTTALMPGSDGVGATSGVIAQSARDVELFHTVISLAEPWRTENGLLPIPWRTVDIPQKIRIGVMESDDVVNPQPPISRGLAATMEKLKSHPSFEVVPYRPWKHAEGVELVHKLYYPDGGDTLRRLCQAGGEPILPLTEWVMTLPGIKHNTIEEWWQLVAAREQYRTDYFRHFLAQNVDFILCPVGFGTAPLLGDSRYWGYTCIWNLLDYPAAVFPTGLRSSVNDRARSSVNFISQYDVDMWSRYKPDLMNNAPICLQLVGPRFTDEKIMKVLQIIQSDIVPIE